MRGRANGRKGERPVALESLSGSAKPQVMAVLPPMKTWAFPQVSAYPLMHQEPPPAQTPHKAAGLVADADQRRVEQTVAEPASGLR